MLWAMWKTGSSTPTAQGHRTTGLLEVFGRFEGDITRWNGTCSLPRWTRPDYSSVSKQLETDWCFCWWLSKYQSQTGKCPCEDQKTNDALPETNIAANKKGFPSSMLQPSRYYGSFRFRDYQKNIKLTTVTHHPLKKNSPKFQLQWFPRPVLQPLFDIASA